MNNSSQTTWSSIKEFTDNPMVLIILVGFLAAFIRITFSIFPTSFEVVIPYVFLISSITCIIGAVFYYKQRKFIMTALFIINIFVSIMAFFIL